MPQFDTFIFSSVLFYLISGFFIFLYINAQLFLPSLGGLLKLRYKLEKQTNIMELQGVVIPLKIEEFPSNIIKNKEE